MPFFAKRLSWDKRSEISCENLKEVAAIAKMARHTANVAKVTAYRAAKRPNACVST